jgi:hypothetical protein
MRLAYFENSDPFFSSLNAKCIIFQKLLNLHGMTNMLKSRLRKEKGTQVSFLNVCLRIARSCST